MTISQVKVKIRFSWRPHLESCLMNEFVLAFIVRVATQYNTKHIMLLFSRLSILPEYLFYAQSTTYMQSTGVEMKSRQWRWKWKRGKKWNTFIDFLFGRYHGTANAQRGILGLYRYHSKLPWKQAILLKPWNVAAVKNIPAEVDEAGAVEYANVEAVTLFALVIGEKTLYVTIK